MTTIRDLRTAAGFLAERRDYLHVHIAPSVSGDGWDVVLRLDGTYPERADAVAAAAAIRERIDDLADVPRDGRRWWDGPDRGQGAQAGPAGAR